MKNFLIILFVFISQKGEINTLQTSVEEKILGDWVFEKTNSTSFSREIILEKRKLGSIENLKIYFTSNSTGYIIPFNEGSERFTWFVNKNIISINYTGENSLCKYFDGDFKILLNDSGGNEKKLELIKEDFSILLSK